MQLVHNQLNKLNTKLGGSISNLQGDRILQCHNDKGIGRIVSVELQAGLSYTEYDMNFVEDLELEIDNRTGAALYFIYVMEGNLSFAWKKTSSPRKEIKEFQTVILGSDSCKLKLYVPKSNKTSFALIKVDKMEQSQNYSPDDIALNQKLFHQFLVKGDTDPYEYSGTFNLKIKDQLLQIRAIKQSGVVRKFLIKGIIHFTLALELMHHQNDVSNRKSLSTNLSKRELLLGKEAVDRITQQPEYPYTIEYLCHQYGTTAAKLQECFRVLAGTTVSTYIKNQRIEMAERLIKGGELNISEVVYTIGFTSRSYFSKIFKERYECTPKYYRENCKNLVSA